MNEIQQEIDELGEKLSKNHAKLNWLLKSGRTPTFQKWLDSLEERSVRRTRVYISDLVHSKGPRNYATPHQR